MSVRTIAAAGLALCAIVLLAALVDPSGALRAWLGALALWSGVAVGSLILLMIARLIGGAWTRGLLPALEAGALTWPVAAVAAVPPMLGMRILYPWATEPLTGFKGAWLSPLPYVMLTLLLFVGLGGLTAPMVSRRGQPKIVASAGLLFLVVTVTLVAVDWLLSLDPGFHSSGFGLLLLSSHFSVAVAMLVLGLAHRPAAQRTALAPLMITALLLSLYLSFTSYFIIWSGDLAPLVGWYARRGSGGWQWVATLVALLQIAAFSALLFRAVRQWPSALRAAAAAMLLAAALQALWFVLPEGGPIRIGSFILGLAAVVGVGLVMGVGQILFLQRRVARRLPR